MSEARSFRSRMKRKWERVLARIEYRRARRLPRGDVASALPDDDEGIHIRGPEPTWGNRSDDTTGNPAGTTVGRRYTDLNANQLATKKLVVAAVFMVEVIALACDTFFLRNNCY